MPQRKLVIPIILLVIVGGVSFYIGRTTAPPAAPPAVTLTIIGSWSGKETKTILPVLEAFENKTGIQTKYVTLRLEDLELVLPSQFELKRTIGDVIGSSSAGFIARLAEEGHLLDLSDIVDPDDYLVGDIPMYTIDGKIYGAPYAMGVKPGFWYRKSFFEKHGLTPPETWDEFLDLLDALKGIEGIEAPIASGDGVGWPISDTTEAFILGRGGPELHRKLMLGKVAWTDPEVVQVFEDLTSLLKAGYFSECDEWSGQVDKFWEGKYGIYFMGGWILGMVEDPGDLSFFFVPEIDSAIAYADAWFVPKYTENPEEAKRLVEFLVSAEGQEIMAEGGIHLAPHRDVPIEVYPAPQQPVMKYLKGVDAVTDIDGAIGGEWMFTFWDQLKLLWDEPDKLNEVLATLEAEFPK